MAVQTRRGSPSPETGSGGSPKAREEQAALEEKDQRDHAEQHRHRIGARQEHRDDRNDENRVAAVMGELLRADDPEAGDREIPIGVWKISPIKASVVVTKL